MSRSLHIRFESDPAEIGKVRREVEQFAAAAGLQEEAVHQLGLCVNEAIANIIRHAYQGKTDQPIELNGRLAQGMVRITLRDWGIGIQPGPLPGEPADPLKPGGLGLICLGRLMDKVTFKPQKTGMLLELCKLKTPAG